MWMATSESFHVPHWPRGEGATAPPRDGKAEAPLGAQTFIEYRKSSIQDRENPASRAEQHYGPGSPPPAATQLRAVLLAVYGSIAEPSRFEARSTSFSSM